jgi:hypothetical protein
MDGNYGTSLPFFQGDRECFLTQILAKMTKKPEALKNRKKVGWRMDR